MIKKEVIVSHGHHKSKKTYILDTNVLVYDPESIFAFDSAIVVVPSVVLEELDSFKSENTDRGRNTRQVIRNLDALREQGSLGGEGVILEDGGSVRVSFLEKNRDYDFPFALTIEDNVILLIAVTLQEQGHQVVFISKDINARVKADVLGIPTEDYIRNTITVDDFYRGWIPMQVPALQLKKDFPDELRTLLDERELVINEFVLAQSEKNPSHYKVFRYLGGKKFKIVEAPRLKWPLQARNPQQLMALDLLLDDSIQMVTLFGPAGTGKTFLAMLAGLHKVLVEDMYKKILVSRPVVPLGKDIGYLPGTIEEKLHNWMLPIYDNMEFIVHAASMGNYFNDERHEEDDRPQRRHGKNKHKRHEKQKQQAGGLRSLDDLMHGDKISLEAITYMRGRSIPYQFIFIDEVQNLSPHEVKTLLSRVGEGSKIILAGDPYQIDSPFLDFISNGLVVASEKFKGQSLFGSVYLDHSERSELSQLVSDLM